MFKIEKAQFSFFLLWFLIVSVCVYLATLLAPSLGNFLYLHNGRSESASNDGTAEWIFSLILLVGLFMGFGQWVVINTRIKKAYGWILVTPIGFSVGSFILFQIFSFILPIFFLNSIEYFAVYRYVVYEWVEPFGILVGTCILTGMFQWIVLRRNILNSFKWSAVMILSFVMGIAVEYLVALFGIMTYFIAFSVTVGLISGIFAEPLIIRSKMQLPKQRTI